MLKENKNIDHSYTDRVVKQLVDETEIDFKNSRVKLDSAEFSFPFYSFGARRADAENLISEPNSNFGKYVISNYGVDETEYKEIYAMYMGIIASRLQDHDENVNHLHLHESTEDKFLDKIVNQLVNETIIEDDQYDIAVAYPSWRTDEGFWGEGVAVDLLLNVDKNNTNFFQFRNYVNNMYGLDEDEINYVWTQYKMGVWDKEQQNIYTYQKSLEDEELNESKNESTYKNYLGRILERMVKRVLTEKGSVIKRSPKYGVGKQVGNTIYLHKSVEDRLPSNILMGALESLPVDFNYDIVKYDENNGNVTFVSSPDWDTSEEPIVGDAILIRDDGSTRYMKQKESPQIYHHKWLFVNDDYSGFNTEESKERSSNWLKLPDIEFNKIGYKKYWDTNVVPYINESKKMKKELITEMSYTDISPEEIMRANKSSRGSGAVGPKAITPRMVVQYIKDSGNKDIKILDFGSGKDAKHTYALRELGLDVTAHDFHSNINDEHHDPNALERVYDIVFASNVLNVQGSENMMRRTIEDVLNSMSNDSIFIANFPTSPRYGFETAKEAKEILEDYFDVVVIHGSDGGRTSSPVWSMKRKDSLKRLS